MKQFFNLGKGNSTISTKQKGILLMLLSALLFSAMQVVIRVTGDQVPLMEQVFFPQYCQLDHQLCDH